MDNIQKNNPLENDAASEEKTVNKANTFSYFDDRPEFEPFQIERRDIIFSVAAILSGIVTTLFGIFDGFALGFSISLLLTFCATAIYLSSARKPRALHISCAVLTLINSLSFFITSNSSVKFFSLLSITILSLVFLQGLAFDKAPSGDVGFFVGIARTVFSSISNIFISIKSLVSYVDTSRKALTKSLIGIVCAVPVLIIVVPLLISSDTAFEGFFEHLLGNSVATIFKILLGIVFSFFIISYGLSMRKQRVGEAKEINFKGIDNIYIVSFLSVISLCYLLYIFSQLAYFFSAFSGFLPEGYNFTSAQYARRGFFEMTAIAAINLIIIYTSMGLSSKKDGKTTLPIKIVSTFIVGFTMLIIVTAVSKMALYIKSFGMTELRITTSAFMIFLAVVFVGVLLKIYIPKTKVLKTAIITAGCILTILGTVNINAFAAGYNYDRYIRGSLPDIDIEALYDFGDEGIPYLTAIADSDDAKKSLEAKNYLYEAYRFDYFDNLEYAEAFTIKNLRENQKYTKLARFTIPKKRAYDALYKFYEENPWFYVYEPLYPDIEAEYMQQVEYY